MSSRRLFQRYFYLFFQWLLFKTSNFDNLKTKEWINEIADYIKASNEEDARYLAQILVAEYGTHYLSRHGYGGRMIADAYLSSSYRFQANSTEEIKNNSRKLFYDKFNVVESVDKDASFTLYESNIKQFKSTCIGCSIATLGGTNSSLAWSILLAQLFKSKAVILRDQEPISSLLEHSDLKTIPILTRRKIKEYIDDTCREYIKRNSFKVNQYLSTGGAETSLE